MRRRWIAGALVAVAAAAPAPARADEPIAVTGEGRVLLTDFRVSLAAGPAGEAPTGSLTTSGFYDFTATPVCVNVAGPTGVSGWRIDSGEHAGKGFLTAARDGAPDEVLWSGVVAEPPATCPAPSEPPPAFEFSGGGGPFSSGALTISGGPPESVPPWEDQGVWSGPDVAPPITLAQDYGDPELPVVPGRSIGPVRLGARPGADVEGVRTRTRRGRIVSITSTSRLLSLGGRSLDPLTARVRATLRRRGFTLGRSGAARTARRAASGRTTTITWRGTRLTRVVVARR